MPGMDVTFGRSGRRRYRVVIERPGATRMIMEPAPGYHPCLPHDLVHYVVESHWGLRDGIYGQLAAGGDAHTFRPADLVRTRRVARASARRNTPGTEVARSERLAAVAFAAWQRRHGSGGEADGGSWSDRLAAAGLREAELAEVVERLDEVGRRWNSLAIGESLTLRWPAFL